MFDIKTVNFEQVEKLLESVPNELTQTVGDVVTREGARILVTAASEYPPERPGQTYERTFAYRDSIVGRTTISGNTVEHRTYDDSDPGHWTRGDATGYAGAWMHVGRWKSWQNIIKVEAREFIKAIINRVGLFFKYKFK